jgi:hypothetical protein
MYFFTPTESLTNTEKWYQRSWIIVVTKLDHVSFKPLELVCWRNLEEVGHTG